MAEHACVGSRHLNGSGEGMSTSTPYVYLRKDDTLDEILAVAEGWGFPSRDIMAAARRRRARAQGRRVRPARGIILRLYEDDLARPYERCDSQPLHEIVEAVERCLAEGAEGTR